MFGFGFGLGSVSLWSVKRRQMVQKIGNRNQNTPKKRLWEIRCITTENLTHVDGSFYSGGHKYQMLVI